MTINHTTGQLLCKLLKQTHSIVRYLHFIVDTEYNEIIIFQQRQSVGIQESFLFLSWDPIYSPFFFFTSFFLSYLHIVHFHRMARRRIALSMSSWFVVPEFDMKDLEILSRASAFLVKAQSSQVFISSLSSYFLVILNPSFFSNV